MSVRSLIIATDARSAVAVVAAGGPHFDTAEPDAAGVLLFLPDGRAMLNWIAAQWHCRRISRPHHRERGLLRALFPGFGGRCAVCCVAPLSAGLLVGSRTGSPLLPDRWDRFGLFGVSGCF